MKTSTPPDAALRRRLRRSLVEWYRREARDLPWRRRGDAYGIWVSEVMLQQTRVETVVDYWQRFMARFPSLEALADAELDEVLALWSGLGYYRRARALHAAAAEIAHECDGVFPAQRKRALALPGVGPYTAAAVLSIAYDQPEALVDGNVERLLARHFAIDAATGSGELKRRCWELARNLVPARGAGEWNQALMELGARVCTPRGKECGVCPWQRSCAALRAGRVAELPRPKAARPSKAVDLELAWVTADGGLLLERRDERERMGGLWQLPTRERSTSGLFPRRFQAAIRLGRPMATLRHAITDHRIQARLLRGTPPKRLAPTWAWIGADRLEQLALSGMTKKALAILGPGAALG